MTVIWTGSAGQRLRGIQAAEAGADNHDAR